MRTLVVLPDDSPETILARIGQAKHAVRVKMFLVSDPRFVRVLIAARRRGVKVRVMLNPARRSGEAVNDEARRWLENADVEVRDTNPVYDVTHEKSIMIDQETVFIQSFNWEPRNFTSTRDYAIGSSQRRDVSEAIEGFESDWHRHSFTPGESSRLIWCRDNGRSRIARFIDSARHSLFIQNERYQDPVIIEHVVRAAVRGVKVRVMTRAPHTLKIDKLAEGVSGLRIMHDVGVHIHKLQHMKLHAKMLLADGERAVIGSINLSPGSFDSRRELAIEVDDGHVLRRLNRVVHYDWNHSKRLDLSDSGIATDLEEHRVAALGALALDAGRN